LPSRLALWPAEANASIAKRQIYRAVAEQRASRYVRVFRAVGVRVFPTAGYFSPALSGRHFLLEMIKRDLP